MTRDIPEEQIRVAQRYGWGARRAGSDYLWTNDLPDGRTVFLLDMAFGNLRIAIGLKNEFYFDDGWCYQAPQTDLAWKAALGWDGEGEPEGWYRHPDSGRRRPGGDPAKEHVYA